MFNENNKTKKITIYWNNGDKEKIRLPEEDVLKLKELIAKNTWHNLLIHVGENLHFNLNLVRKIYFGS